MGTGVVCFSFFFWLRVLDKAEYSAFESTLNSSIVSYRCPRRSPSDVFSAFQGGSWRNFFNCFLRKTVPSIYAALRLREEVMTDLWLVVWL